MGNRQSVQCSIPNTTSTSSTTTSTSTSTTTSTSASTTTSATTSEQATPPRDAQAASSEGQIKADMNDITNAFDKMWEKNAGT